MRDRLIELLQEASTEAGKHFRETTKKVLAEKGRFNSATDIDRRNIYEVEADHLLENGVVVLPYGAIDALYSAVNALADMVDQFGYSTTFRKQDAVCDGGLSALENAFSALYDCGFKFNSNFTINRKNLRNYNIEETIKNLLKGDRKNGEK